MLIKIRNTLIDPEEVQTVTPDRNEEREQILIGFKGGCSCWIEGTMEEAEAALINAGVVTDLTDDHDPVPPLTDAEVEKLYELKSDGYKYLARDKDGRLYAFRHKPKYGGFYWDDPDPAPALHVDGMSFVSDEDEEPTEICSLIEKLS